MSVIVDKGKAVQKKNEQKAEKKTTGLIFTIGNAADGPNLYAIPAESVKEILREATVFPLPFVPPYVNGVLNRYGDPYVVIDSAVLDGKSPQNSKLFIVLNDESHSCLRVTDVKEFYSAAEESIAHFSEEGISDFYDGTITVEGQKVFVLNIQAIIEKVGKGIAAA